MKLLHITATHLNKIGGVPVVLRDLVDAQNAIADFNVRVLSVKADITEINSAYFDYLGNGSFEEYIEEYAPDVVIFHSHFYFVYRKLYKKLLKNRIPYFIEPHGSFGTAALKKSKFKKMIANQWILNRFMKFARGYIFLNKSEKEDSMFRTKNDLVIPNGIQEGTIFDEIKETQSWSFYFIGRYDIWHKGLDCLFDAFDILEAGNETFTICLYGSGSKEEKEYIAKRIEAYESLEVLDCGPVYEDEQERLLEQRGVMLLVSRYEGFPMTVLEAWKFGNPCIVTPGTNVYEEVQRNRLGWCCEFDATKVADTMIRAKQEYETGRIEYVEQCKKYVKAHYTWDVIAKNSFECLSEIYQCKGDKTA